MPCCWWMITRAALSSALAVGSRGGELAVEALRLRVMAKKLRAEADLAEVELANEKVGGGSTSTGQTGRQAAGADGWPCVLVVVMLIS